MTFTRNENCPDTIGMPDSRPDELSTSPGGRRLYGPTDHVSGSAAFVMFGSCWLYGDPTLPNGRVNGKLNGNVNVVTVIVNCRTAKLFGSLAFWTFSTNV